MKKRKPISLEDRKVVQLEMLKEIDAFCRTNKIRYSLAFGTLLGAIRHKGFIPWDDDVDIMMPLPDMLLFKKLFHSNTMKYCDVDTDKNYEFPFSRIANINTYNKIGIIAKTYGICIDLYPVVSIPRDKEQCDSFFFKAQQLTTRRFCYINWRNRLVRHFPCKSILGFNKVMKNYRDWILNKENYGESGLYYAVAGYLNLRDKMIYDFDLFDNLTEVEFESYKFLSIAHYDKYLSMRYGNYMQLPPENERHPYHGGKYYWR